MSDPLTEWTEHTLVATEQISVYRQLADGRIVTPHVDPTGAGGGFAERSDGTWTDRVHGIDTTDVTHVFDMLQVDGVLYASGADGDGAVVWASLDDGATWVKSLDGTDGTLNRFYAIASIAGSAHVYDPVSGAAYRWDGTAWVTAPAMLPAGVEGGPGQAWRDGIVLPAKVPLGTARNDVYYFDGTAPTLLASAARGFSVGDDGVLYLLLSGGVYRIGATGDLTPTMLIPQASLQFEGCALCVLPGCTQAVIGRADSSLSLVTLP